MTSGKVPLASIWVPIRIRARLMDGGEMSSSALAAGGGRYAR